MTDKELHKKVVQPFFKVVSKKILPKLNPSGRLYHQVKNLIIQYEKAQNIEREKI
jgi:hypothetical protein